MNASCSRLLLVLWVVLSLCGPIASVAAAAPVTLLTDGRFLLANSDESAPGDPDPCGGSASDYAAPPSDFAVFDATATAGSASASQQSQVGVDGFAASGTGVGFSFTCSAVRGESHFQVAFRVDEQVHISLTGTVSAEEGSGDVHLKHGAETLVYEGVNFGSAPVTYDAVLVPGDYMLSAHGESWEGYGSYDLTAAMTPVATVPVLWPLAQGVLVVACAGVGAWAARGRIGL